MEFMRFVFSSFWIWAGFVILIATIGEMVQGIVTAIKKRPPEAIDREKAYAELLRAKARAAEKEPLGPFCNGTVEVKKGGDDA